MSGEGVTFSRRTVVVGGLLIFLVGLATKTLLFPAATTTQTGSARRVGVVSAGPARVEAPGVPVGFARTTAGATFPAEHLANLPWLRADDEIAGRRQTVH